MTWGALSAGFHSLVVYRLVWKIITMSTFHLNEKTADKNLKLNFKESTFTQDYKMRDV